MINARFVKLFDPGGVMLARKGVVEVGTSN
jgi:hypothetical protein